MAEMTDELEKQIQEALNKAKKNNKVIVLNYSDGSDLLDVDGSPMKTSCFLGYIEGDVLWTYPLYWQLEGNYKELLYDDSEPIDVEELSQIQFDEILECILNEKMHMSVWYVLIHASYKDQDWIFPYEKCDVDVEKLSFLEVEVLLETEKLPESYIALLEWSGEKDQYIVKQYGPMHIQYKEEKIQ